MSALGRLDELLAQRATQPLAPALAAELQDLLAAHPDVDSQGFDLAAAAITLALAEADEPMPAHLKAAILERAGQSSLSTE